MSATPKTPCGAGACLAALVLVVLGCGSDDDFANDPRPPLPIELTGVIQSGKLTVSPTKFGAGPVLITISNQTDDPHTVTLSGGAIKGARVGPVEPANTASIQRTLEPGDYEVSAGGEAAVEREIKPARLAVGAERESSSGDLSLP